MITFYYFLQNSDPFNQALKDIDSMPQFFNDAMYWGLDLSYLGLGFMSLMALGLVLFKR